MRSQLRAPLAAAALSLVPLAPGAARAPQDGLPPAVLVDTARMDPSTVELLKELAEAVRAKPADGAAHAELGLAYEANTIWALAERQYDNAVKLLPDKPEWLYRRGLVRFYNGDLEAASQDLGEAAQRLRNTAVVQARHADVLRMQGRLEEAEAAWTQAIAAEANQPGAIKWPASRVGLAQTLIDLGRYERALELADEALELAPDSKYAHYTRGLALRELGREEEARVALVRGMDAFPEFPTDPHWQRLGDYGRGYNRRMMGIENMLQTGDIPGATAALQAMLAERPEDHFALNLAARATMMGGDVAGARFLLDKSLAANPDSPSTHIEYTIVLLNEMAQLQQQSAQLIGQPGQPGLADVQKRIQDVDAEARAKISRALQLTPLLGRAHYYAALVQLQTAGHDPEKLQGVMQSMTNALRLGCSEPRFYRSLAEVYMMAGRPREMVKFAELAAANAPDNVEALMFLVQAYATDNRDAEISGAADKLVAAGPKSPEALHLAILAYNRVGDFEGSERALALLTPLSLDRPDLAQFIEQVRAFIAQQRAAGEAAGPPAPPETPKKQDGGGE